MAVLELKSSLSISSANFIEAFHFENLVIKVVANEKGALDFFNFKNQEFHIGTISWKNCEINDLKRSLWYQIVDGDRKQTVEKVIIEDCRFFGLNSGQSGFFGLSTKQDAPVHRFEFRNSTFHANDMTKALITGVSKMKGNLDVVVENCTFIAMKTGMTFFDLKPSNTDNFNVTVKNNLFSGVSDGASGTWINLGNVTTRTINNNYITNGFTLNNWGVEENEKPMETTLPMDGLFQDVNGRDFTITDNNSEIYTNNIGDPHWIK